MADGSITQTLAWIFGLYIVAVGAAAILRPDMFPTLMADLKNSPALIFIAAIVTYVVGATMVAIHSDWSSPLAVIVSLLGWTTLIKGLILIVAPGITLSIGDQVPKSAIFVKAWGLTAIVLGGWLAYAGLT